MVVSNLDAGGWPFLAFPCDAEQGVEEDPGAQELNSDDLGGAVSEGIRSIPELVAKGIDDPDLVEEDECPQQGGEDTVSLPTPWDASHVEDLEGNETEDHYQPNDNPETQFICRILE